jgi:hypothetical protein
MPSPDTHHQDVSTLLNSVHKTRDDVLCTRIVRTSPPPAPSSAILSTSNPHVVHIEHKEKRKKDKDRVTHPRNDCALLPLCVCCWFAVAWLPRKDCWRQVSRTWSKWPVVEVEKELEEVVAGLSPRKERAAPDGGEGRRLWKETSASG